MGKNLLSKQLISIVFLTLVASILPEVIFREGLTSVPAGLPFIKLAILFWAGVLSLFLRCNPIAKYILVLGVMVLTEILTKLISSLNLWQEVFDLNSLVGNFGGSILLKIIGVIPVVGVLIALFKSPKEVYLAKGDMNIKAEEIKWLNIKKDRISWEKMN